MDMTLKPTLCALTIITVEETGMKAMDVPLITMIGAITQSTTVTGMVTGRIMNITTTRFMDIIIITRATIIIAVDVMTFLMTTETQLHIIILNLTTELLDQKRKQRNDGVDMDIRRLVMFTAPLRQFQ
jgi:hypothetical protein